MTAAHRRPSLPALVCAVLLALGIGLAPLAGSAQDTRKFGFVNISRIIAQSEDGQAEAAELDSLGAELEQELGERRAALQAQTDEYDAQASEGQADAALGERIEAMRRQLERDMREAQSEVDTARQDRIQAIGTRVVELVREFAREQGYTAIFRIDGGQVVFAAPEADITEQLIEAYNQAYPVD